MVCLSSTCRLLSIITFFTFSLFFIEVHALEEKALSVPLLGRITLELPLPVLGAILGLMDGGFNPCALSVFFFLVAYLLSIGSRKKCLSVGIAYSLVVFAVYFSFMYGILKVISIIGFLETIKTVVGVLITIGGFIELKDFLFYGRWISLEIPRSAKPTIERLVKAATIPSAIALGFFVSLVEIPCAGAFPFVYLTILAERSSEIMYIPYIVWYNLFFIFPLVGLTIVFYFGFLEVEKAEEVRLKLRRYMRLVAGIIMILLGVSMIERWI